MTKCTCQYRGREIEYRVTNSSCFQHGQWVKEEVEELSARNKALYAYYRAPYMSTKEKEVDWWMNYLKEDINV